MNFRNNRNTILLAFILLMLAGVALLESSALVVLILLGLLFLVRQFDNNQLSSGSDYRSDYSGDYNYGSDEYDDVYESQQTRQAQSEPVYRHALEAVQRAGLNPDSVQVLAVDIGMMAINDNGEPTVFRTWTLPDDIDYVQPFVQLRLPSKANGRIKFEVIDSTGKVVFVHEDNHKLERGRNFIMPAARLPIHDSHNLDGQWGMRVSADGVILADHQFEFSEATNSAIRRHIGEDGEINTELRAVMAESRLPKMSLDDLLSYQEEDEQQQGRQ
ncbi:MAG: hypothetical protein Q9P01_04000 [Anaerolineae bacterium]|nr:hypothetical protein [Anaerolineae bacterium]MDQ7034008.1 hypothetical protein [Anaerolineae bacterium]